MTPAKGMRALNGADQAFLASAERLALLPVQWTTTALSRCAPNLPQPETLTVGQRERLLLELRRISLGERLDCTLMCPSPGCGEKLDLELRISDLLVSSEANSSSEYEMGRIRFRLVTGADQEAAALLALSEPDAATDLLFERCVVASNGPLLPEEKEALSTRLSELDPQAEMRIDVRCAACGNTFSTLLDAASYLREELKSSLKNLYREVHTLAWHYHWSAAEILSLTVAERKRYLQLIDEQLGEGGLA